eukprot:12404809-Karenia_brevis.AAC.1
MVGLSIIGHLVLVGLGRTTSGRPAIDSACCQRASWWSSKPKSPSHEGVKGWGTAVGIGITSLITPP